MLRRVNLAKLLETVPLLRLIESFLHGEFFDSFPRCCANWIAHYLRSQ